MLFALVATDKPGHLETRMGARPDHVAFLTRLQESGSLALAGPFLDAEGNPCGSLVVVKAESQAEAEALLAQDPYNAAGLFAQSTVRPWRWTFGAPEGL